MRWQKLGFDETARDGGSLDFAVRDFVADHLGGFPQTFCNDGRADVRRFGELTDFAFPATDENRAATCTRGGFKIRNTIANHVAVFQVDAHVGGGLLKHGDAGLAAVAFLAELADFCVGVVETIVDVVDSTACFADGRNNRTLKRLQRFTLEVPFSDTGLIGNDGDTQAEVIEQANRLWNVGQHLELRTSKRRIHYPRILVVNQSVDYTIAVEENCFHRKREIVTALATRTVAETAAGDETPQAVIFCAIAKPFSWLLWR